MRQNFIIALLLVFILAFGSAIAFAQSPLLPEKTVIDTKNTGGAVTPAASSQRKDSGSEDTNWMFVVIALMLVSLFLLFLEIAIIPGFGVAGISGVILLFLSLGMAYWKLTTFMAVITTLVAVFGTILLVMFVFFVLPNTRLGKQFILEENSPAADDETFAVSNTNRYLGAEGVAVSNLRPSGIAKIAGERVDVITEGDFVDKDTKIKVVKTTAGRVIVAPLDD